jgi:cbb3-type cytochrome oxidase subunit 3
MNIFLLIAIILVSACLIFYMFKMGKNKQVEKNNQEEMNRQRSEEIMRPEIKLHEEEKKRWENKYYKRQ